MTSENRSPETEALAFSEEFQLPLTPFAAITTFPGLDLGSFPGNAAMAAYKQAGFAVACVYLANRPGRIDGVPNHGWIGAASGLAANGWGLVPTYVGAQESLGGDWRPLDPANDAQTDAAEAIHLAALAGLEPGRTLFLDVEAPFEPGTRQDTYAKAWIAAIRAAGFAPALYGFPHQIQWAQQNGVPIWTVHLNSATGTRDPHTGKITFSVLGHPLPADPIDPGALGTQGRFYCQAAGLSNEIDYDRWRTADPSRP